MKVGDACFARASCGTLTRPTEKSVVAAPAAPAAEAGLAATSAASATGCHATCCVSAESATINTDSDDLCCISSASFACTFCVGVSSGVVLPVAAADFMGEATAAAAAEAEAAESAAGGSLRLRVW